MKKNAVWKLVKDLILVAVLGGIAAAMCKVDGTMSPELEMFFCVAVAGVPFGWRWASKLITAVTFKGIGIKLLISVCLGCIAIFVIMIGDLIGLVSYLCSKAFNKKQEASRTRTNSVANYAEIEE